MRKRVIGVLCLLVVSLVAPLVLAQGQAAPGVEITWPPPVSEVWGTGDVTGTAAVPGMAYYYLEYLPLNNDLSLPDNAPWIPMTIAIERPVISDTLATIDTTRVADGLYALRLVVNTRDGQSHTAMVSPIRVSNERFSQVIETIIEQALDEQAQPQPTGQPTAQPTTAPADTPPSVTPSAGLASVNVRRCDLVDNYRCAQVGYLSVGDTAEVLALSSNGSGWFQVRLPSGLAGWVSPTVVAVTGDISNLPRVAPPAPLPPQPPQPTAPPTIANVIPNGIAIQGNNAVCGQTFNVQVNITNIGNAVSQPGTISLQDVNIRTGEVTFTSYGSFPALNPGANYVVIVPVLVGAYYNEQHQLRAYSGNQQITLRYTLQPGNCSPLPTPTPQPGNNPTIFPENQCFVVYGDNTPAYERPDGNILTYLSGTSRSADRGRRVNDRAWYRIHYPDLGNVWVRRGGGVQTQGNCRIN